MCNSKHTFEDLFLGGTQEAKYLWIRQGPQATYVDYWMDLVLNPPRLSFQFLKT